MKRFEVRLTRGAERDLQWIKDFIRENDTADRAAEVTDRLLRVVGDLATLPQRGAHPSELAALGIREYRQVLFKPYRIVYRIVKRRVFVYLIADGRRDMQSLLARRLLEA